TRFAGSALKSFVASKVCQSEFHRPRTDRSKVAWQPKITCGKLSSLLAIWLKSSGSNSVVECQLPKLDVAGSSPVSRSSNHKQKAAARTLTLTLRLFVFGIVV